MIDNQRKFLLITANAIFVLHVVWVLLLLFGWAMPILYFPYIAAIIATLLSEVILGYCIFTKWEFEIRKRLDPHLNYDPSFISYYAHKWWGFTVTPKIIRPAAVIFLSGSLVLSVIFHNIR